MAKTQVQKSIVVRGIAHWPNTHAPMKYDARQRRSFEDPEGDYKCDVLVDPKTAKDIEKSINDVLAQNPGICTMTPSIPVMAQIDKETGKPTGQWIVRTKQKGLAGGRPKRVVHVDAARQPITDPNFRLTGGSDVKVAAHTYVHSMGVTLYIDAIQVITLAAGADVNIDDVFDKEDGFTVETADEDIPF